MDAATASALSHVRGIGERLDEIVARTDETAQRAADRLQQMSTFFMQRFAEIQDSSGEAANLVKSAAEIFNEQAQAVQAGSRQASARIREVAQELGREAADLVLTTDQSLIRVDQVRRTLNVQTQDLAASVGLATTQLTDAGTAFRQRADEVIEGSGRLTARLAAIGQEARREAAMLSEAADRSGDRLAQVADRVRQEQTTLTGATDQTIERLRLATLSVNGEIAGLGDRSDITLGELRQAAEGVRDEAASLAERAAATTESLALRVSRLEQQIQEFGATVDATRFTMERTGDSLTREASTLNDVAHTLLTQGKSAADTFAAQAQALSEASRLATVQAEALMEAEIHAKRDTFLSASKFVLESLHSMSIDFSRLLDVDTPDKSLKGYAAGDMGIFTRRLLGLKDRVPTEKIRAKFESDSEMRGHVNRYVRQFEELLDQAGSVDHGGVLNTTLLTSDVGKLYAMLCAALGRQRKGTLAANFPATG
jgi:hypothetical protein